VQLCCCSFALQGNFSALQEQWSCIHLDRTNAGKRTMVAIEHIIILLIGHRRLVETFCGTVCRERFVAGEAKQCEANNSQIPRRINRKVWAIRPERLCMITEKNNFIPVNSAPESLSYAAFLQLLAGL
jgi:hypothetical protein